MRRHAGAWNRSQATQDRYFRSPPSASSAQSLSAASAGQDWVSGGSEETERGERWPGANSSVEPDLQAPRGERRRSPKTKKQRTCSLGTGAVARAAIPKTSRGIPSDPSSAQRPATHPADVAGHTEAVPLPRTPAPMAARPTPCAMTLSKQLQSKALCAPPPVDGVDHRVVMPWEATNQFRGSDGQWGPVWPVVSRVLRDDQVGTGDQLVQLLKTLLLDDPAHRTLRGADDFHLLKDVVDCKMEPSERQEFFTTTLPWMRHLVLSAPDLLPKRLPVLKQKRESAVRLTELQVCALLCCGFFSLFPGRYSSAGGGGRVGASRPWLLGASPLLAPFNFHSLFSAKGGGDATCSKIQCLLTYFCQQAHRYPTVTATSTQAAIEYVRLCEKRFPDFSVSTATLLPMDVRVQGLIEESDGCLQVDFANKALGGGVLRYGCVQEEIRFVTSPELLVSRLLAETLQGNEAVLIGGAAQYTSYTGYASTFRYTGARAVESAAPAEARSHGPQKPPECSIKWSLRGAEPRGNGPTAAPSRESHPMRNISVVAMDAENFTVRGRKRSDQFHASWILREMRKAYVSFRGSDNSLLRTASAGTIATGNWGCGAFGGDHLLKLLIQWCAASELQRPLRYFTFGDEDLARDFKHVEQKLLQEQWTVGDVYRWLLQLTVAPHERYGPFHPQAPTESSSEVSAAQVAGSRANAPSLLPAPAHKKGRPEVRATQDTLLLHEQTAHLGRADRRIGESARAPERPEGSSGSSTATYFERSDSASTVEDAQSSAISSEGKVLPPRPDHQSPSRGTVFGLLLAAPPPPRQVPATQRMPEKGVL